LGSNKFSNLQSKKNTVAMSSWHLQRHKSLQLHMI
jgi:hypothetical protein